ncbi:hypothetical protein [Natrinema versiforme]|uniref:Ribbon-helix-helix protein, CopG family n=1 Tax=Natrinema versiforme TaxID=88724 RepID=A0A4P8WIX1_9EURY|nr:hypothetical protein [Natrinema versiforme]QCS43398.1 hypothetical protein FEJ81_13945 [Natrinema versiforme]
MYQMRSRITVQLPEELYQKLNEEAEEHDKSLSAYVRMILDARHSLRLSEDPLSTSSKENTGDLNNMDDVVQRIEELENRVADLES